MNRAFLLFFFVFASCMPQHREPSTPLTPPPGYRTADTHTGAPQDPDRGWWLRYDDPTLHALVAQALQQNLGLRARWAQLEQAKALANQARAARFPTVSAQGTAGYNRSISAFATSNSIQLNASLPVAYEVDLFARAARNADAAELDYEATAADRDALAITTSAQVAEGWYDLVNARAQRSLLEEQHRLNETYLELVQLRFQQGLTSATDVHQQRQQVATTEGQLELNEGNVEVLRQQLAVLLGAVPSGLPEEVFSPEVATLPDVGDAPRPGVPAEVLEARPDVRAAQRRVQAADHRIAAAVAARLPSLRLNVTPGYTWQRNELSNSMFGSGEPTIASGWTFNAGATLNVPLFDGFLGRANVNAQEAVLQTQVENLAQVVLQALVEVEGAIVQERQQHRNVAVLTRQVEISGDTLRSARDRYRQGLTDFLPVLAALQSQQAAQLNLLAARRQLLSSRIQLHRALGGTWPEALERPTPTPISDES